MHVAWYGTNKTNNAFLNLAVKVRMLRSSLNFTFASLNIASYGAFTIYLQPFELA